MNYQRGNSGELSVATCMLNLFGNVARVYTTFVLTKVSHTNFAAQGVSLMNWICCFSPKSMLPCRDMAVAWSRMLVAAILLKHSNVHVQLWVSVHKNRVQLFVVLGLCCTPTSLISLH